MTSDFQTSKIYSKSKEELQNLLLKLKQLGQVSIMLSAEYELNTLLALILSSARDLTNSDAGSIFLRYDVKKLKQDATAKDPLHDVETFISLDIVQNDTIDFPFKRAHLKIDSTTIAGYVATSGNLLNIKNAYELPQDAPYKHNTSFDQQTGYVTKSMLVVPMQNINGEITGVLQLINKRRGKEIKDYEKDIIEFNETDEELAMSLASQAAVCVERTSLLSQIENMFKEFVTSLCNVLEKRNYSTSGHCFRMAQYAVRVAEAINRQRDGFFKDIKFSKDQLRELEYAGLLHDIGKLAVPEAVLEKKNKLTDAEIKIIEYRFNLAKSQIDKDKAEKFFATIKKLNIPDPEGKIDITALDEIKNTEFIDIDGQRKPLITDYEYKNLAIKRGNLTQEERKEIEKHVVDTWEILKRIPWPEDLEDLPRIAAVHHERTDGSGYPWGFKLNDIPLEGRILAMVDIFEALTAIDRPYKPALPIKDSLRILEEEVTRGKIDKNLFDLFVKEKIYNTFADNNGFVKFRRGTHTSFLGRES